MKKTIFISVVVLMLLGTFVSSCKKASNSPQSSSFNVKINDTLFTANSLSIKFYKATDTLLRVVNGQQVYKLMGVKFLYFTATGSNGQKLYLSIQDWRDSTIGNGIRTNNYYFNQSQFICYDSTAYCAGAFASYGLINYTDYAINTGAIVISSCDSVNLLLSGTFSGKLYDGSGDSLNLTNGSFTNVPYTIVP